MGHVREGGEVLKEELKKIHKKFACVGDVRAIGLFSCVELVKDKETKEPIVPYGRDPEAIMPKIVGMLKQRYFMTYSPFNMFFFFLPDR